MLFSCHGLFIFVAFFIFVTFFFCFYFILFSIEALLLVFIILNYIHSIFLNCRDDNQFTVILNSFIYFMRMLTSVFPMRSYAIGLGLGNVFCYFKNSFVSFCLTMTFCNNQTVNVDFWTQKTNEFGINRSELDLSQKCLKILALETQLSCLWPPYSDFIKKNENICWSLINPILFGAMVGRPDHCINQNMSVGCR